MANDTSTRGESMHDSESGAHNQAQDTFFASAHHDHSNGDDVFSVGHSEDAQNQPVQQVPIEVGTNVIRVPVTPGEILELAAPFNPDANMIAREANGNLAIKVGDVTVILEGFINANNTAPVVVESSDGKPIDIATVIAQTDPAIDIQTAAGPAAGPQGGQGADNTGAILALLQGGAGLGGLNAVGAQDGTSLSYGLIDNAIIQDRFLLTAAGPLGGSFVGIAEPFLRDPVHHGANFVDFDQFYAQYSNYVDTHPGDAWADFTGTAASGDDFASYLAQTSFTSTIGPDTQGTVTIDQSALQDFLDDAANGGANPITSDGSKLDVIIPAGDPTTAFVIRESDHALIMVFHAHDDSTTGNNEIDTYLIDRLDHPQQGQDVLGIDIPYQIQPPLQEGSETPPIPGSTTVNILDDIPVAGDTTYVNFLHSESFKDALDCFDSFSHGKLKDVLLTNDAGHVDEDYIFQGNHDKDNANGPDSDPVRGDDIGDKFVVGQLNINFGADGPSGAIPNGDKSAPGDPKHTDADPQALTIAGYAINSTVPDLTSHGNDLVVLKHETNGGIEILQVGYHSDSEGSFTSGEGGDFGDTIVFTLILQTNPNQPLFGGFAFELCEPLDHPVQGTLESNLELLFPIIATDDDGDHPTADVTIKIDVNDDAPYFSATYYNSDGTPVTEGDARAAVIGGTIVTHDFGHVDEDWLATGNHDRDINNNPNPGQNGDDIGGTVVTGQLDFKYGADGPGDPGDQTPTLTSLGVGAAFKDADGNAMTSQGNALVVLSSDGTHISVGYGTTEVFKLDVNDGSTGHFTFTLEQPIDHPFGDDTEKSLLVSFEVTAPATDFDGDPAVGAIKIMINDDAPESTVTYVDKFNDGVDCPADPGVTYGQVDEDWLANGNKDNDNPLFPGNEIDPTRGDEFGTTIVTGQIGDPAHTHFGADGPGTTATPFALALLTVGSTFLGENGQPVTQDGENLVVQISTESTLIVGLSGLGAAFTLTLDPTTGKFEFDLLGALDEKPGASKDPEENNLMLSFGTSAPADFDGDGANPKIRIQVNDDAPVAVNDVSTKGVFVGNVLTNDMQGADGATVTAIKLNGHSNHSVDQGGGDTTVSGKYGDLTIHADGSWSYDATADSKSGTDTFTYTLTDGDGDKDTATLTVCMTAPTHANDSYDHSKNTSGDYDASTNHNNETNKIIGTDHNDNHTHTLSGGDKADFISGNDGDDTIHGKDGDDTIFGGSGNDTIFGDAGHNAMSGGTGDDVIHAGIDDFSSTNLLDGIHSIDGGAGHDTLEISGLAAFGTAEAAKVENIEALDLNGGAGTHVTLSADAVYGVTQVGGLEAHTLTISGDAADKVDLTGTAGTWTQDADTTINGDTYSVYHASAGGGTVVVHVDQHITDQTANV